VEIDDEERDLWRALAGGGHRRVVRRGVVGDAMTIEYWLMDARAMDPDQFYAATVYEVAKTVDEARTTLRGLGAGVVIIKVEFNGDEPAAWRELVTP
jgi:hypothetical protein